MFLANSATNGYIEQPKPCSDETATCRKRSRTQSPAADSDQLLDYILPALLRLGQRKGSGASKFPPSIMARWCSLCQPQRLREDHQDVAVDISSRDLL